MIYDNMGSTSEKDEMFFSDILLSKMRGVITMTEDSKNGSFWLRFIKGMFIGSGFILPGVSGGALAAIFGIYERMISFLANLTKQFKENFLFFLPVGLGALFGIFLLSFGVSFLLGNYETIILWFFVGCIVGTLPSLWKEAGKEGRSTREYIILAVSFIAGSLFLWQGSALFTVVEPTFLNWIFAGVLIALGMIVPGLSPSNFLLYMGLYKLMADGFKNFDLSIIIPIGIGGLATVLLLSKLMNYIFSVAFPQLFHFILGIVLASTVMIIPTDYSGISFGGYIGCILLLLAGTWLGAFMSRLENKYK